MVPTGCFKGPAGSELGPWMFSTLRVSRSGDGGIACGCIYSLIIVYIYIYICVIDILLDVFQQHTVHHTCCL